MNEKKNGVQKPAEKKDGKVAAKVTTATATPATGKPVVPKADSEMKLSDLAGIYLKKKELFDKQYSGIKARLDAARKNIDRLTGIATQMEQKLSGLTPPSVRDFINPLAKALTAECLPGYGFEIVGPVGLTESVSIVLFPRDTTEDERMRGEKCKTLTIMTKTKDGSLKIVDYAKDMKTHSPGTLGYASFLNFATIPVPDNATVQWFMAHLK